MKSARYSSPKNFTFNSKTTSIIGRMANHGRWLVPFLAVSFVFFSGEFSFIIWKRFGAACGVACRSLGQGLGLQPYAYTIKVSSSPQHLSICPTSLSIYGRFKSSKWMLIICCVGFFAFFGGGGQFVRQVGLGQSKWSGSIWWVAMPFDFDLLVVVLAPKIDGWLPYPRRTPVYSYNIFDVNQRL